jgi:uridine kinase
MAIWCQALVMLGIDFIKQNSTANNTFVLGVSGGSGSGKTYFAKALQSYLGDNNCSIIYQDDYYIDQSKKFDYDGGSVNFDHPDSLDFKLLAQHICDLKANHPVQIPTYDFATHTRTKITKLVEPKPVIIVDGILIFNSVEVRPHLDELVFFDTPEELRFQRRLDRDVKERGRDPTGVKNQFEKQVRPMHEQFVEPSKKYADHVAHNLNEYKVVLDLFKSKFSNLNKTK